MLNCVKRNLESRPNDTLRLTRAFQIPPIPAFSLKGGRSLALSTLGEILIDTLPCLIVDLDSDVAADFV